MNSHDLQLLEQAKKAAGGKQQQLAKALGVTPSAVSNWVSQKKIPSSSRDQLLSFLRREGHTPSAPKTTTGNEPDASDSPGHLSTDAERCGFWADSAWCFNYIADPSNPDDDALTDEVWRAWKGLRVTRPTTFRHYFRYQPFDDEDASTPASSDEDCFGYGFLGDWRPADWSSTHISETTLNYLGAHAHLEPGAHGSGGYFVRAHQSVLRWAANETAFEFVGFKPECPVHHAHLVLSIPKKMRAPGLLAAFRMATDYPQYYDFAGQIVDNQGSLSDIVEPWGRDLTSEIRRLPQALLEEAGEAGTKGWKSDWSDNDREIATVVVEKFSPSEDRDVYIVTDHDPPPLATLLMFWPLPMRP